MLHVLAPHATPTSGAVYPDLSSRDMEVSVAQINGYIGVSLGVEQVEAASPPASPLAWLWMWSSHALLGATLHVTRSI